VKITQYVYFGISSKVPTAETITERMGVQMGHRLSCVAAVTALGLVAAGVFGVASARSAQVRVSRLSLAGIPQHNRVLGRKHAPVVMDFWGDPQSPYSRLFDRAVLPALVAKYVRSGKLQIRWRSFTVVGRDSVEGEQFVFAAGLQNHLWDMIDDIFANQGKENGGWLNASLAERIGETIPGFSISSETANLDNAKVVSEINGDQHQARLLDIEGVPFVELGRLGHPRRPFWFMDYKPPPLERAINRLLGG
jgi:protein-disulfide isomerase